VSLVDDWYTQRPSLRAVALRPFSVLFGALVALRRALYRGGVRRSVAPRSRRHRRQYHCRWERQDAARGGARRGARAAQIHPGVVSRGYGRDRGHEAPIIVGVRDDRAGSATSRCSWREPAARWPSPAIALPRVWRCFRAIPDAT
jgi:hypothetical protein